MTPPRIIKFNSEADEIMAKWLDSQLMYRIDKDKGKGAGAGAGAEEALIHLSQIGRKYSKFITAKKLLELSETIGLDEKKTDGKWGKKKK